MTSVGDKIQQEATKAAVKVALEPPEKRKSTCFRMVAEFLWGEEGAKDFHVKLSVIIGLEIVFAATVIADILTGGKIKKHGIHPREFPLGLLGVLSSPFLHNTIFHWLLNAVPFMLLGMLVMLRKNGIATFVVLTILSMILGGTMVWVLGHSGNHIGSSGLVFSYFGYLLVFGIVSMNLRDIFVSLVVFLTYGSLFFSLLPTGEHMSWESHVFGLFVGGLFGWIDAKLAASRGVVAEAATDEERQGLVSA
eukprot:TRINITY_DN67836_c9_g6_i1.p1 TRINITY_DN67836_c9_g6~~TRINITY_DN67836_c9_g6_i1.p1  ORF type:complete len:250 (+),score=101.57 TRINITY_DN67836_c9_g6_i1:38-787(+)